jgi:hypothetical protein
MAPPAKALGLEVPPSILVSGETQSKSLTMIATLDFF